MRYDGEPILVMWIAIALVIFSVIPIANLLIGTIAVLYVAAAFLIEDDVTWKNQKEYGRLLKFLHRKIS